MFDPNNKDDLAYIAGFSDGVKFVLGEIEHYIERRSQEPRITKPVEALLRHLKGELGEKSIR